VGRLLLEALFRTVTKPSQAEISRCPIPTRPPALEPTIRLSNPPHAAARPGTGYRIRPRFSLEWSTSMAVRKPADWLLFGCVNALRAIRFGSIRVRRILPGWDALSVHLTAEVFRSGPRAPGRHERDRVTQLPVRCSTASGVSSCAADEPVRTRLELSPRPCQGPRHGRCQRR
jgi:hypothetical protein